MLIVAIILLPASKIWSVIYGRQWREWEYNLVESWGINSALYDLIKAGLLVSAVLYYVIWKRRKRKKDDSRFYELPKS